MNKWHCERSPGSSAIAVFPARSIGGCFIALPIADVTCVSSAAVPNKIYIRIELRQTLPHRQIAPAASTSPIHTMHQPQSPRAALAPARPQPARVPPLFAWMPPSRLTHRFSRKGVNPARATEELQIVNQPVRRISPAAVGRPPPSSTASSSHPAHNRSALGHLLAKPARPHQTHSAIAVPYQTSLRAILPPTALYRQTRRALRADHTAPIDRKSPDRDKCPPRKAAPPPQSRPPEIALALPATMATP